MHMLQPLPQFLSLVTSLRAHFPNLAYLHLIEPRVSNWAARTVLEGESNDPLREIWKGSDDSGGAGRRGVVLSAGGYASEDGLEDAETNGDLIAFGRHYISNVRLLFCIYQLAN